MMKRQNNNAPKVAPMQDQEKIALTFLKGDISRFEEFVIETFNQNGYEVKSQCEMVSENGYDIIRFQYDKDELVKIAECILSNNKQKEYVTKKEIVRENVISYGSDITDRHKTNLLKNAARIAQILPKLWDTIDKGKPTWSFAQTVARIAGGIPTSGGRRQVLSLSGKKSADAGHSKEGGSRDLCDKICAKWASGKYSNRDICAEEEYTDLGFGSFKTARNALLKTPNPNPWPAKKKNNR